MKEMLPLFGAIIIGIGGLIAASRHQARTYRNYLSKHTDETRKMTANQDRLITQGEKQAQRQEAQISALERIATALEKD